MVAVVVVAHAVVRAILPSLPTFLSLPPCESERWLVGEKGEKGEVARATQASELRQHGWSHRAPGGTSGYVREIATA